MSFKHLGFHTALGVVVGLGCQSDVSSKRAPQMPYTYNKQHAFDFAQRHWAVRTGSELQGAGPNVWGGLGETVFAGPEDVTLRLVPGPGQWRCAEISTEIPPGTHTIEVDLNGPMHQLDANVILGVFVYKDDTSEFDLEFAKWGDPFTSQNTQFVLAPANLDGHLHRFALADLTPQDGTQTMNLTQRFRWQGDRLWFWLLHDRGLVNHWHYQGDDVPEYQQHRLHINLWLFKGNPPLDGKPVVVSIKGVRMYGA